ncbi:DNA-binding protein modulo [Drosophila grimshawi]|uniref:GH13848 n=1 Tax=Drosophila grimshawi TaxID=7222 RepID=B4JTQ3_DROGR|nr:DNA-binding protein modulo [Drosophila grimshawi]EDV91482.1 GH13848 [Drosophila grimshawi]
MALKKLGAKKAAGNNKRGPKAKQVVEEKPAEEVESSDADSDADEEQNGVNLDDGSSSESEGAAADLVNSEAEEDDEDDDDDDDDEVEPGEVSVSKNVAQAESEDDDDDNDQADSDEEPAEAPIEKNANETPKLSKKGGIPKVAVARIPQDTPKEQILFVSNLPNEYKHVDLVALFTKFGPIAVVNRIKSKAGGNSVSMAFESAKAVDAALAAKEKALTLDGQVLNVARAHNKDDMNARTIVVGLIGPNATKDDILAHFKSCGAIEAVTFSHNKIMPTAYVRFAAVSSIPKAVKLHGSDFNSRFITVREEAYKSKSLKAPGLTLTVANTGNHETYKSDTIEKIFKKHGEVVDVDVVCTRAILCFVTYKTADEATKAFNKLNGKTISELEIKLDTYHYSSSVRTILVTNLHPSVDEQQINDLFSEVGEVESVKMLGHKALVRFTTDDGFCKSFLLNERLVQGQPIFLEPNSTLKHKIMQNNKGKYHAGGPPAGGKFQKFNNSGNNNNKNFTQRPFNKRPAQANGSTPQSFKKAKRA